MVLTLLCTGCILKSRHPVSRRRKGIMSSPFDALAAKYDTSLTASPIARYLRARVNDRLDVHFGRGDHVLEIGCGTGEDALFLAERGIRVTATDSSPAMLEIARARTAHQPLITVQPL